ncbi:MAG TPA: protein-disulfide reductase DsbD domain-containing protein, partial [Luteolibacter sp.]
MNRLFTLLPCAALVSPAFAEEATVGVDLALISEVSSIAPGKPFTVALKVHHHPDFHTYWQSPGIVGVPFAIEWKLPPGFAAGPLQWPAPQQVKMAGHLAHGYERDVLLMTELTPPANLSPGRLQFQATASWMACAAGCYPEKKTLTLDLPVNTEATSDPSHAKAFAQARAELPRPLEHWSVVLESATDEPEIRVKFVPVLHSSDPGQVYFFSSDGQISSEPPQRIEALKNGGFRLIAPRAQYSPKGRTTLPGVLR